MFIVYSSILNFWNADNIYFFSFTESSIYKNDLFLQIEKQTSQSQFK